VNRHLNLCAALRQDYDAHAALLTESADREERHRSAP